MIVELVVETTLYSFKSMKWKNKAKVFVQEAEFNLGQYFFSLFLTNK